MAINFPSTVGQPTDGTFIYVASGITYSWNGESWTAAGSGATATDRTVFSATNVAASGGGSLAYNSNNGVFTFTPPNLSSYLTQYGSITNHTDITVTNPTGGQVLAWNGPNLKWENTSLDISVSGLSDTDIDSGGFNPLQDGDMLQWDSSNSKWINSGIARSVSTVNGAYFGVGQQTGNVQIEGLAAGAALELVNGGSDVAISIDFNPGTAGQVITATGDDGSGNATGVTWQSPLPARTTSSFTINNLNNGASSDFSIVTPPCYALLKIETSHASWVTLYTDTTSRTADSIRAENTDPFPGSGVIAEVITAGSVTQLISPGTIGYNSSGDSITYGKAVNNSGTQINLQVVLTYVPLEA